MQMNEDFVFGVCIGFLASVFAFLIILALNKEPVKNDDYWKMTDKEMKVRTLEKLDSIDDKLKK